LKLPERARVGFVDLDAHRQFSWTLAAGGWLLGTARFVNSALARVSSLES
jgi:hypothetical protein